MKTVILFGSLLICNSILQANGILAAFDLDERETLFLSCLMIVSVLMDSIEFFIKIKKDI
jgi:hypothetical protein